MVLAENPIFVVQFGTGLNQPLDLRAQFRPRGRAWSHNPWLPAWWLLRPGFSYGAVLRQNTITDVFG